MRVCFCTHSARPSGAQRCLELLLETDGDRVIEPLITVPGAGANTAWLRNRGIKTEIADVVWWVGEDANVQWQGRRFYNGLRQRVERFEKIFAAFKPELVVSNTSVILEPAMAAARLGIPHLWHVLEVIGSDPDLYPVVDVSTYGWLVAALSDSVVAVSQIVARELVKHSVPERMISVINTGIDVGQRNLVIPLDRKRFGFDEDDTIFIYVGLLSQRKGVAVLARSISHLSERNPKARFIFVGRDGGVRNQVKGMLSHLEKRSTVSFLGHRDDALSLMAMADAVIMPSIIDPLPVTVLEAMCLSKPVIATRSGGCEEMVVDGETGLLVSPNNSVDLANAIIHLASDREMARRWGINGYERIRSKYGVVEYSAAFISRLRETNRIQNLEGRRPICELLLASSGIASPKMATIAAERSYDAARALYRSTGLSDLVNRARKS